MRPCWRIYMGFSGPQALFQSRLQPVHGLAVKLADPGLGYIEDLAYLLQRKLLVIIERDYELFLLWQGLDGLGYPLFYLVELHDGHRVLALGVLYALKDVHALVVVRYPHVLEVQHAQGAHLAQYRVELLSRYLEEVRHLLDLRGPSRPPFDLVVGLLKLVRLVPHRAGHPVH